MTALANSSKYEGLHSIYALTDVIPSDESMILVCGALEGRL